MTARHTRAGRGHSAVHVAGTGPRPPHRPSLGHLQFRHGLVRDARRVRAVPARHGGRNARRDRQRRAAGFQRDSAVVPARWNASSATAWRRSQTRDFRARAIWCSISRACPAHGIDDAGERCAAPRVAEASAHALGLGFLGLAFVGLLGYFAGKQAAPPANSTTRPQRTATDRFRGTRGVSVDLPGPEIGRLHGERERTTGRSSCVCWRAVRRCRSRRTKPITSSRAGRRTQARSCTFRPPSPAEAQGAIWSIPALGGSPRRIMADHRRRRRQPEWPADVLQPRGRTHSAARRRARRFGRARHRAIRRRLSPLSALVSRQPVDRVRARRRREIRRVRRLRTWRRAAPAHA